MDFLTGGSFIIHYEVVLYFGHKQRFKVKTPLWCICFSQTHSFSLHKTLIDGLETCFYQLFILSFWRHPFTAEDQLVSESCNAKFLQIFCNKETNSSTSWMPWGWEISANFPFLVNYSFKVIFVGGAKTNQRKLTILCLKYKLLYINFLFIELSYKGNIR